MSDFDALSYVKLETRDQPTHPSSAPNERRRLFWLFRSCTPGVLHVAEPVAEGELLIIASTFVLKFDGMFLRDVVHVNRLAIDGNDEVLVAGESSEGPNAVETSALEEAEGRQLMIEM